MKVTVSLTTHLAQTVKVVVTLRHCRPHLSLQVLPLHHVHLQLLLSNFLHIFRLGENFHHVSVCLLM